MSGGVAPATPLPWVVDHDMAWVSPTFDHDMPVLALRTATDGVCREAEALQDAAYIVHAANCHPDLVEALQWALDELNGRTRYDEDVADQQIENCYRIAEAALAKAREGGGE